MTKIRICFLLVSIIIHNSILIQYVVKNYHDNWSKCPKLSTWPHPFSKIYGWYFMKLNLGLWQAKSQGLKEIRHCLSKSLKKIRQCLSRWPARGQQCSIVTPTKDLCWIFEFYKPPPWMLSACIESTENWEFGSRIVWYTWGRYYKIAVYRVVKYLSLERVSIHLQFKRFGI